MIKKTGFLILIALLLFGSLAPGYAAPAQKKPVKQKKLRAVTFKSLSMDKPSLSSGIKVKGEKGEPDQIRIPRQNKEENNTGWGYSTTE